MNSRTVKQINSEFKDLFLPKVQTIELNISFYLFLFFSELFINYLFNY